MLFYCYNYFLRISPSVMENSLTQTFHITATQFGALAGFYYWSYTPMQLPAGMIYDRFGTRIVLSLACLVAVSGLMLFISANNYALAGTGRLLIGFGTAFSYIGVLKLASLWLPANRFATVAGLTTATGMTCAALSEKYLASAIERVGYQHALHTAVIAGFVLSMVMLFIVRNQPKQLQTSGQQEIQHILSLRELFSALYTLASHRQMWLIGLVGCLLYLPASVFLDLWGVPYLETVYHLTPKQAVNMADLTFAGWIIAGPIIGMISDKICLRRLPLMISASIAGILLCMIFYSHDLSLTELYICFFVTGFCCGAHPLCFALSKESSPPDVCGTAIAATNLLIMAGGAIFQPVVGKLLDWHTTQPLGANGLPVYSASDFTFALSVIPVGVLIGIILSMFIRETHCKVQS
ncbi:MAG: MFS transporter [Gammaproteobacteria bacterium]|nr:MFS transporter [Gammaproteobacteria bacterium]